ncbi:AI-2E family transporter [Halococcus sediminicola]|uniref:AI-2E family transporter n=1 Tax=Halococcus sediminicola TaxID=1264579 RepID=UPI0009AE7E8A|nr:AI-2E family transporter [Halococcus sediminicola]
MGEQGQGDRPPDEPVRPGVGWWLFAAVLAAVLVVTLDAYVGWLVFGVFLYYVARPINRRLGSRIGSPSVTAGLTMLVIVLPFVTILALLVAVAVGQLSAVRPADVETLLETLAPGLDTGVIPTAPDQLYRAATDLLGDPSVQSALGWVQGVVGASAAQAYNGFLALIFVFFLVRDEDRLAGWVRANVVGEGTTTDEYLRAVDRGLDSVFFGYTLTIFAIMVLSALIYTALNLLAPPGLAIPQPVLAAVATGLATVVPLVGRSIVYVVIVAYLSLIALRTDPTRLWFPVLFYVLMGLVFDNLVRTYIRPYLSGRLFHNGLIMFAYLLGPPIFGWYGIFLGPLLMVVVVQFLELVFPRMVGPDRRRTAVRTPTEEGTADDETSVETEDDTNEH